MKISLIILFLGIMLFCGLLLRAASNIKALSTIKDTDQETIVQIPNDMQFVPNTLLL